MPDGLDSELYTMPSGCWSSSNPANPLELDNPKLFTAPHYSLDAAVERIDPSIVFVPEENFDDYAQKLIRASQIIKAAEPRIVLVPKRGGVRLWKHLSILSRIGADKSLEFPFTGRQKSLEETYNELSASLAKLSENPIINIVCVDAANGGQGSARLIEILLQIYACSPNQTWKLTLCLFVPKDKEHAAWKHDRAKQSEPHFKTEVHLFGVSHLIGEDMAGAMISPDNFGVTQSIRTRIGRSDYLLTSTELPAAIDQKIAESIHAILQTDPDLVLNGVY